MKNKKKKLVASMLVAIVLAGAGFTYAYFTDSKTVNNVINMGNVAITLKEEKFDALTNGSYTIKDVLPNKEIVKDPTIALAEGSNDAYVRAKITYSDNLNAIQQQELENGMNINKTNWFKGDDGYFYYKAPLTQENKSVELFTSVHIPESWGSEIAGKELKIDVKAEAIQKDSFTPAINASGMIINWLDSKNESITVPTV